MSSNLASLPYSFTTIPLTYASLASLVSSKWVVVVAQILGPIAHNSVDTWPLRCRDSPVVYIIYLSVCLSVCLSLSLSASVKEKVTKHATVLR